MSLILGGSPGAGGEERKGRVGGRIGVVVGLFVEKLIATHSCYAGPDFFFSAYAEFELAATPDIQRRKKGRRSQLDVCLAIEDFGVLSWMKFEFDTPANRWRKKRNNRENNYG